MSFEDLCGSHHHFVPDIVVVRVDDPLGQGQSEIERAAELVDGDPVEEGDLLEGFNLGNDALQRLRTLVGFIKVRDARPAVRNLRSNGFAAGRIAGLQFAFHYISGETKPTAASPRDDLEVEDVDPERIVAIVDTGVAPATLRPDWMQNSIIADDEDIETAEEDDVSHGTFVASLIRQVAQQHAVSVAKADVPFPDEQGRSARRPMTTEAHVSDAILRLIDRHGDNEVEALNISLGGSFDGEAMVLLRTAIDAWQEAQPDSKIFAAAGNSERNEPVYPAAHQEVVGVGAANRDGEEIVWEDRMDEGQPNEVVWDENTSGRRTWVDHLAPGSQLWGAGGRGPGHYVCWSGSSFASALAAAGSVDGRPSNLSAIGRTVWEEADLAQAVSTDCCD